MVGKRRLGARLEALCARYGADWIENDPVSLPRRYTGRRDQEVAAFIAAALAYGNRIQIRRSADSILGYLGERPHAAVRELDPVRAARHLSSFSHRFNSGRDVAILLAILKNLLERYDTLNGAFLEGYDPAHPNTGTALSEFCRRALATEVGELAPGGRIGPGEGVRFFFSSPAGGSACKRLNMFLRWMVRRDEVDLGIWEGVPRSKLVVPVDTHMARVSRQLGLTRLKSPGWAMALEITASLSRFDPEDPVRYDFALYNWGADRRPGVREVH